MACVCCKLRQRIKMSLRGVPEVEYEAKAIFETLAWEIEGQRKSLLYVMLPQSSFFSRIRFRSTKSENIQSMTFQKSIS